MAPACPTPVRPQDVESLSSQLKEVSDRSSKDKLDQDRKLDSAKDYINRMQIERSDIEKRFHAMKEDLLTRLQNACTQRDEARAQVLELQADMDKLKEQLTVKERQLQVSGLLQHSVTANKEAAEKEAGTSNRESLEFG